MKFLTKVFKTASKQEDVIIPAGLDNLTTPGITKGVITLFSEVARATQIAAGANSTGWVQTIQTVNNLAFADRMRSIGLADTVTVKNSVDTIVSNGAGNVINQATVETFSGGIPSNFATSNSIIRNSYDVLIPEKKFYSNTQNFTANVDNFNSYVSNQLDNNVKLNRDDFFLSSGIGTDFYLQYFKLGFEIKLLIGTNNLILKENNVWTNSIDKVRSRMVLFTITFEG